MPYNYVYTADIVELLRSSSVDIRIHVMNIDTTFQFGTSCSACALAISELKVIGIVDPMKLPPKTPLTLKVKFDTNDEAKEFLFSNYLYKVAFNNVY